MICNKLSYHKPFAGLRIMCSHFVRFEMNVNIINQVELHTGCGIAAFATVAAIKSYTEAHQ